MIESDLEYLVVVVNEYELLVIDTVEVEVARWSPLGSRLQSVIFFAFLFFGWVEYFPSRRVVSGQLNVDYLVTTGHTHHQQGQAVFSGVEQQVFKEHSR